MALPSSRSDREQSKFVEDGSGNVAVRTTATITGDLNVDSTSVSTSGYVGKASGTNADFTTAYASGTTLTCSSLPTDVAAIKADDIVSIVQVATGGGVTETYTRDDAVITAAGTDPTTITVTGATFAATDSFIVYTNIQRDIAVALDEFPAAAAITDNFANPTTTSVMGMTMAWDGSAWDRMLGDSTNGMLVNLGTNNDVTATCTATDLDIRDLSETTDSVAIYGSDDGGTTKRLIKTDAGGAIQVDLEVANVALTASTLASTTALAASLVAKASAGTLAGVSGVNTGASAQYIQVHNTASLPADTAVPVICFKVEAGENFCYTPVAPVTMSTGITICNSSTVPTKTIGAADCWIQVEYS